MEHCSSVLEHVPCVSLPRSFVFTVRLNREPRFDFSPRSATAPREKNSENIHPQHLGYSRKFQIWRTALASKRALTSLSTVAHPFNCLKYGGRPKKPLTRTHGVNHSPV